MLFLLGYQFLTSLTTLLIDIKNIVPNSQRKYFLYIFHYLPPIQNNIFIFEFPHSPGIQINFSHQIIVLLWFLLPFSTRNIRKSHFFDQKKKLTLLTCWRQARPLHCWHIAGQWPFKWEKTNVLPPPIVKLQKPNKQRKNKNACPIPMIV